MYSAPLEISKAHISCKNLLRKQSRSVMVVIKLGSWMSVIVPVRRGRTQPYAIADIRTRRVGAVLLRTLRVDTVGAVLERKDKIY